MSLLGNYKNENGLRCPPSLLSQSLAVCIDSWRNIFVNPSASCRMKWPGGGIIADVIVKLRDKLQIRDIKGMCLSILEADPEMPPIEWVRTLYQINDIFSESNDYFSLITEVCLAIPEQQKLTLMNWIQFLSSKDLKPLSLRWTYALRHRVLPDETLVKFLGNLLQVSLIDPLTIDH